MTTDLKVDPGVIKAYKYYHSKEGCWPEVAQANVASGIEAVKIYLQGNRLFMSITVPVNTDQAVMDSLYAASGARMKEWAAIMSQYQQAPPGAKPDQIWVPMELIHNYEHGEVK